MYYSIHHLTRLRYSSPIRENVVEVRMQPRTEGGQRGLSFNLSPKPHAQIFAYRDHLGNQVHHFSIPKKHTQLTITAKTTVELTHSPTLPDSLPHDTWAEIDQLKLTRLYWDMVAPSQFAHPTPLLHEFVQTLALSRSADPLTVLRQLNSQLYECFDYKPEATNVDSPIDEALSNRQGVCQDFSHIMIALVRHLGIPCRYVSGYLYHHPDQAVADRSAEGATHAWVETFLPSLGWVGFDPTNNLIVDNRHIRVAVGRDYADVPPNRGVFKGDAKSELTVLVRVTPTKTIDLDEVVLPDSTWARPESDSAEWQAQQQQQ